jgi:hypothetical protein
MKAKPWAAAIALLFAALSLPAAASGTFRYGAGVRFSSFGVPNALLDLALFEHPRFTGNAYSFELHSYGKKGPRSAFSAVYCLEYSRLNGEGFWRVDESDPRLSGSGEATQVNFTASILMHIFLASPVHPYLGIGVGVGRISIWAEGSYQNELGTISDSYEKKTFVPVGHLPVGIIANIHDRFLVRAEAGFKNGFYFGGGFTVNF